MSVRIMSGIGLNQLTPEVLGKFKDLEVENQILKEIIRRMGKQLTPPMDTESLFSEIKRGVLVAERLSGEG